MSQTGIRIGIVGCVLAIFIALVGGLGGCEPRKNPITAEFDRTNSPMLITFVIHDSHESLAKELANQLNVDRIDGKVYGFAQWFKSEEDINPCVLHLLKPKYIDDEITLTWGHELAHCAYGTYHKETVGR